MDPCDLRKSFDTLHGLMMEELKESPPSGGRGSGSPAGGAAV